MRILSLDGGGYLGLATAKFIAETERRLRQSFHDRFDLFCGTSTGAILALGLAHGLTGNALVDLYLELGAEVFPKTYRRGYFRSKYDDRRLREALRNTFGDKRLEDVLSRGKMVLVPAFNLTEGRPRVFKTDHSPDLSRDSQLRLADIALASAAAPSFLPVVLVRNETTSTTEAFCDGGVVANQPALLGLAEALTVLNAPPETIAVLSISTPRRSLAEPLPPPNKLRRGLWGWRRSLPQIFIDAPSVISHEALQRLTSAFQPRGLTYERVELHNRLDLRFDDTSSRATEELLRIGVEAASTRKFIDAMRPIVGESGGNHGESPKPIR